jgi:hypothetical protein
MKTKETKKKYYVRRRIFERGVCVPCFEWNEYVHTELHPYLKQKVNNEGKLEDYIPSATWVRVPEELKNRIVEFYWNGRIWEVLKFDAVTKLQGENK